MTNPLRHREARRQCAGKQRHESKGKAEAHLRAFSRRYGPTKMQVYFCRFCKGYHVGHPPKDPTVV